MEFNSQICTTEEQSKRLLALGLKIETADMRYQIQYLDLGGVLKECTSSLEPYPPLNNDRFIPAWSLHRLLEIADMHAMNPVSKMENWYDDLIAHIQSCIHLGYINEEYLNMDIVELREKENMELLKNGEVLYECKS